MNMSKKRGFTLVELLAVIVILTILTIATVYVIGNVIEDSKIKKYYSEEKAMVHAAKLYIMEHKELLNSLETHSISLQTLIDNDNIKPIFDSGTGGVCNQGASKVLVKVGKNKKSVSYNACLKCSNYQTKNPDCEFEDVILDEKPCELENDGDIYYIDSEEDLYAFSLSVNGGFNYSGKTVKLRTDLDMSKPLSIINKSCKNVTGFDPIGDNKNSNNRFAGTFDGQGYVIKKLTINKPNDNYVGLFGYSNGLIRGLNIENINVTGKNYVGGVAGYLNTTNTSNPAVVQDIKISGSATGSDYVGGIVGRLNNTNDRVRQILSTMNVSGSSYIGGIAGYSKNGGALAGLLEDGTITKTGYYAGAAYGDYGSNSNKSTVYVSDKITIGGHTKQFASKYIGRLNGYDEILDTYLGGDNDSSGYYFDYDNNKNIIVKSTGRNPLPKLSKLKGTGTLENPYKISSIADWNVAVVYPTGKNYELTNDLDFNNEELYMLGSVNNKFTENFIGNGYKLKNYKILGMNYTGLIGYSNGTINGLNIEGADVDGNNYVGGIVGYLNTTNTSNPAVVQDIKISGSVTGSDYVGGIAGRLNNTNDRVRQILSTMNVSGASYVGGLAGYSYNGGALAGLLEDGTITATGYYIGSAYGDYNTNSNKSTVWVSDKITVGGYKKQFLSKYLGRLNGYDEVIDTYLGGDNDSSGYYFDYDTNKNIIVKSAKRNPLPQLSSLRGTGTLDNPYKISSIADWNIAVVYPTGKNYELTADIDFNNEEIYMLGSVSNKFTENFEGNAYKIKNYKVLGIDYTGLIGYSNGLIKGLNIEGANVDGNNYVGGVAGYLNTTDTSNPALVNDIKISGDVTGNDYIGGIVGRLNNTNDRAKQILSTMNVSGDSYIGGVAGYSYNGGALSGILEDGSITATGYGIGAAYGYNYDNSNKSTIWVSDKITVDGYKKQFLSKYLGRLNGYDEVIDTYLGGDNDSSGYYFDYDANKNIIVKSTLRDPFPQLSSLSGAGTKENPYKIRSKSDWNIAVVYPTGKSYKLATNIDFNNEEIYMLGSISNKFTENFEGDGYKLKNYKVLGIDYTGLIGYSNGLIKGLNIEGANVDGNNYVGGISGYVNGLDSTNKSIIQDIKMSGDVNGTDYVGGLAGKFENNDDTLVKEVLTNINVSGSTSGGLVGYTYNDKSMSGIIEGGTLQTSNFVSDASGFCSNVYVSTNVTRYGNPPSLTGSSGCSGTGFANTYVGRLNGYDEVLDTYLGGDNDSSGYYFDYDTNKNIIVKSTSRNPFPQLSSLSGAGTKENPYKISSKNDWDIAVVYPTGKNYELTADIDFNNEEIYMLGSVSNKFTENFEGNGYKIKNYKVLGINYTGLFGYANGLIKGINVEGANVDGKKYVGGISGCINGLDSTNKSIIQDIKMSGDVVGESYVGGLAGELANNDNSLVKEVLTNINVSGSTSGGLVGYAYKDKSMSGIIEGGTLQTSNFVSSASGFCQSVYVSTNVTRYGNPPSLTGSSGCSGAGFANTYVGRLNGYDEAIDTYLGGDNDSSGYYFDYDTNKNIIVKSTKRNPLPQLSSLSGAGTIENPYKIRSKNDWNIAVVYPTGKNYELTADIDFNNEEIYMLGSVSNIFNGTFDGGAYRLKNAKVLGMNYTGLFGYLNGNIKGLNVENVDVDGYKNTGGLTGYAAGLADDNQSLISDVAISGNVNGYQFVGGMSGQQNNKNGLMKQVLSNTNVTGHDEVGGLSGSVYTGKSFLSGIIENGVLTSSGAANFVAHETGFCENIHTCTNVILNGRSTSLNGQYGCSGDGFSKNHYNDLSYYDNVLGLESYINGDRDSSGYYFDDNINWTDIEVIKVGTKAVSSIEKGLNETNPVANLSCTDDEGIVSYYFGTESPTPASDFIPVVAGKTFNKTEVINEKGTYYLACKDTDGRMSNISSKTYSNYRIDYELYNGDAGEHAPTKTLEGLVTRISNPSKVVFAHGDANGTGAAIGIDTFGIQTFEGWTFDGDTEKAKHGKTSTSVNTLWNPSSTKVRDEYFRDLSNVYHVTLTANWEESPFKLPSLSKTGYNCGWNTESDGTGTSYESKGIYTPQYDSEKDITVYAQCTGKPYNLIKIYNMGNLIQNYGFTNTTEVTAECKNNSSGVCWSVNNAITIDGVNHSYHVNSWPIYDLSHVTGYMSTVSNPHSGYHAHLTVDNSEHGNVFDFNTTNQASRPLEISQELSNSLVAGSVYEISMDIKKISNSNLPITVGLAYALSNNSNRDFYSGQTKFTPNKQGWQRFTWTFKLDENYVFNGNNRPKIYIQYDPNDDIEGEVYIDNVSLSLAGSLNKNYGSAYTNEELETPIREGYIFDGWYTENGTKIEVGTTTFDRTNASFEDIYEEGTKSYVYARWIPKTYTLVVDLNGGSWNSPTVTNNKDYAESLERPTREGYRFLGWDILDSYGNTVSPVNTSDPNFESSLGNITAQATGSVVDSTWLTERISKDNLYTTAGNLYIGRYSNTSYGENGGSKIGNYLLSLETEDSPNATSPGLGGFCQTFTPQSYKTYIHIMQLGLGKGLYLHFVTPNCSGDGCPTMRWLTDNEGHESKSVYAYEINVNSSTPQIGCVYFSRKPNDNAISEKDHISAYIEYSGIFDDVDAIGQYSGIARLKARWEQE